MAPEPKRADALQFIFSLFLGVLLVVVIGVGVWTFYQPPFSENSPKQQRIQELYREQEVPDKFGTQNMTPAEQAKAKKNQEEINTLQKQIDEERKSWAVVTSIILLVFATILLVISLFLPESAKVFSNGILLGGLFTVIYGTGVSFTGGDSRARFFVVLAALVISIGVGYLRFMREKLAAAAPAAVATTGPVAIAGDASGVLSDLAARVAALESKTAAAAAVLGDSGERHHE